MATSKTFPLILPLFTDVAKIFSFIVGFRLVRFALRGFGGWEKRLETETETLNYIQISGSGEAFPLLLPGVELFFFSSQLKVQLSNSFSSVGLLSQFKLFISSTRNQDWAPKKTFSLPTRNPKRHTKRAFFPIETRWCSAPCRSRCDGVGEDEGIAQNMIFQSEKRFSIFLFRVFFFVAYFYSRTKSVKRGRKALQPVPHIQSIMDSTLRWCDKIYLLWSLLLQFHEAAHMSGPYNGNHFMRSTFDNESNQ